jgi:hypothetical protein
MVQLFPASYSRHSENVNSHADSSSERVLPVPNSENPSDLLIKFHRIGRTGTTPEAALTLHVPARLAADPDRVAEVAHAHCRRHLNSRFFDIDVDFETDEVLIDYGRFGRGRIHRIVAARPYPSSTAEEAN